MPLQASARCCNRDAGNTFAIADAPLSPTPFFASSNCVKVVLPLRPSARSAAPWALMPHELMDKLLRVVLVPKTAPSARAPAGPACGGAVGLSWWQTALCKRAQSLRYAQHGYRHAHMRTPWQ
jgi:hypothetical protein